MSVAERTAKLWDSDAATYHSDLSRLSHTSLEVFADSRLRYYRTYVEKSLPPKEPTDSLLRGSLVHLLSLEPHRWSEMVVDVPRLAPDGKKWLRREGSEHEKWWAEFEASAKGKLLATDKMTAQVKGMAESILACRDARKLLEAEGMSEQGIVWTDEETGLDLKCRPDKWIPKANIIADIKSVRSIKPRAFAGDVQGRGYYRQDALYADGIAELTGDNPGFWFIAVEATVGYEVAIYDLHPEWLVKGEHENAELLRGIVACRETGDWTNWYQRESQTLEQPDYAKYESRWLPNSEGSEDE